MKTNLTASKIERLRPKSREFTLWDSATPHFGVRITPTGTMRFIHLAPVDGRLRKRTIGDARRMPLEEARAIARGIDEAGSKEPERKPYPAFGEWVVTWWERSTDDLKPRSIELYRYMLDRQLLPVFGTKPLDEIDKRAVIAWFEGYSRTSPGAANKALMLLGAILELAVRVEILSTNPARNIRKNPGSKLTRFLSDEERERLLVELDRVPPVHRVKALAVKMLLFTGCRRNEILGLRWREVENGILRLEDSKVGARKVWLGDEAQTVLDKAKQLQDKSVRSEYVFPHHQDTGKGLGVAGFDSFWLKLRVRAGIPDVRLHDLRHSFASEAVRRGIPLPVVSKLLGHTNITMTMRYAHVSNADVEAAAERIGQHLFDQLRGVA